MITSNLPVSPTPLLPPLPNQRKRSARRLWICLPVESHKEAVLPVVLSSRRNSSSGAAHNSCQIG